MSDEAALRFLKGPPLAHKLFAATTSRPAKRASFDSECLCSVGLDETATFLKCVVFCLLHRGMMLGVTWKEQL